MPRMCEICGVVGGGVGGMSPVIRTRASTPAESSLRAARAGTLKMSSGWALSWGEVIGSRFGRGGWTTSSRSVEGLGGGGGVCGTELSLESLSVGVSAVAVAVAVVACAPSF